MLLSQPYRAPERLTDLPNINLQTVSRLAKVGVNSVDDLLNGDPYQIFDVMLKKVDSSLKRQDLANLVGAYKGCHGNTVLGEAVREYKLRRPSHIWKE